LELGNRPPSGFYVKMKSKDNLILTTIPYIKNDVSVIILFRALGSVSDKDIIQHIIYDFRDQQLMELLRPSLEDSSVVENQAVAKDFIGKRGNTTGAVKEKRIEFCEEILQKELLPHVGIGELCFDKKSYFLGYMVHRLLLGCLGRRDLDDRDHYGNKRLDLAGKL
jgi:DNA-directed RNA polymerase II subunit RPB2